MVTLRWVAIVWAATCLVALFFSDNGAGSTILAVVFFILFLFICWTLRAPRPNTTRKVS